MEPTAAPSSNVRLRFIFMGIALASTTCSSLFLKLQDNETSDNMPYIHPFLQCILMYLGQLLCLYADMITQSCNPTKPEMDSNGIPKPSAPSYVFGIPALFDGIGTSCYTFGMVFCALSFTQMMGGAMIVGSAVFSIIFLKKKLVNYQILSITLIFIGIMLAGASSIIIPQDQSHGNSTSFYGLILLFIGNVIWSLQYVVEEKLFGKYTVSPLQAIGTEGLAGMIYFCILLLIFQFAPCSPKYVGDSTTDGICIYGVIEDSSRALSQMFHNGTLLGTSLGYIFIIAFVNYSLIAVVKYGSAIHSCIVGTLRTILLWAISLLFLNEKFNWVECIAFLIIVFGSLLYNEILVLPCAWMKNGMESKKEIKEVLKLEEEGPKEI